MREHSSVTHLDSANPKSWPFSSGIQQLASQKGMPLNLKGSDLMGKAAFLAHKDLSSSEEAAEVKL